MDEKNLSNKVFHATKWATLTELCAKLITPITSMVLARLLTPDAFGVVATINMIVSFADMFTDAGFQKYLIQHEFSSDLERDQCTTVAFWTNLGVSLILWCVIAVFRNPLATLVGSPGLGVVLMVAALSLPMTSFSSIQLALFKRKLEYKTLFYRRIIGALLPFVITIPIAYCTGSYWALVCGTLAQQLFNALILTVYSPWKPNFFFKLSLLKEMLSFTLWTLLESFTIWINAYIDIFIVGTLLSTYYLGLYKNSTTMVNQIFTIVTSATTPILFSTLCRKQNNQKEFSQTLFLYQRNVSLVLIPMGVGIYLYRAFVTDILLGSQWSSAQEVLGVWAVVHSVAIILNTYSSEVYRAKGLPKVSVFAQILYISMVIPVIYTTAQMDFRTFYLSRFAFIGVFTVIHWILMAKYIHIYPWQMLRNLVPAVCGAVIMFIFGTGLQQCGTHIVWNVVSILLCAAVYFVSIWMFPSVRKEAKRLHGLFMKKRREL